MAREVDIAWAAGFIDGEAWIGAVKGGAGRAAKPTIEVAQNVRAPLDRLKAIFGGRIEVKHRRVRDRSTRAVTFHWRLEGACHARRVLPMLMPYLLVKGDDARRVLAVAEAGVRRSPRLEVPG